MLNILESELIDIINGKKEPNIPVLKNHEKKILCEY